MVAPCFTIPQSNWPGIQRTSRACHLVASLPRQRSWHAPSAYVVIIIYIIFLYNAKVQGPVLYQTDKRGYLIGYIHQVRVYIPYFYLISFTPVQLPLTPPPLCSLLQTYYMLLIRPQGILLQDNFVVCGDISHKKRIGQKSYILLLTLHNYTLQLTTVSSSTHKLLFLPLTCLSSYQLAKLLYVLQLCSTIATQALSQHCGQ